MIAFSHDYVLMLRHAVEWLRHSGILPPDGVSAAAFIPMIWLVVQTICTAVMTIAQYVIDAGELVFNTISEVAQFAAKGIVWLTATVRDGFGSLVQGFENLFGAIGGWMKDLANDISSFFNTVKTFIQPLVTFLNQVYQYYMKYWNEFVQPVLKDIQRVRQALSLFKALHLQWAQQVDSWLADVQQQIVKNTLWVAQQIQQVIGWVNSVGDPYGFLKYAPMLGGFVNGLDQFWMAICGQRFFGSDSGYGSAGSSTKMTVMVQQQISDLNSKAGDAGDMYNREPGMRSALFSEMGVKQAG
jgi:hypothetical protein